jgi:hypothetical protein
MGTRRNRRALGQHAVAILLLGGLSACEDAPTEPILEVEAVSGIYSMTVLRFDPDGSLPENNLLPPTVNAAQLNLTAAGQAQVVWVNPATGLVVTVSGTYETTTSGVRIQFAEGAPYAQLLLSREMSFTYSGDAEVLTFDGASPDGVNRARLFELAPTLASEQLHDPTPGRLRITFTRN